MNIKDKNFMYYDVGGEKFHSDLKAFQHFTQNTKLSLSFNLNYRLFDEDWTKEPPLSISAYRSEMCDQIAARYDRIIIAYSGGTDSETLVDEFKRKRVRNIELLHTDEQTASVVGARKWLRAHMKTAIEKKHMDAVQELGWKITIGETWQMQDSKKLERTLADYEEGCWNVDYRMINPWHLNNNINRMTRSTKQKTCLVFGKEKPQILIRDGWWCFQLLNANWQQPIDCVDNDTDLVYFYVNDYCSNLIKKLSHAKAVEMEKIFIEEHLMPTTENSMKVSVQSGSYRERLLKAMGYNAITRFLNTNGTLLGSGWHKTLETQQQMKINPNIHRRNKLLKFEFFDDVIAKTVDSRFIDVTKREMHGIWGKPIKVRPLSDQLRNMK
jgi:hypothetical protein